MASKNKPPRHNLVPEDTGGREQSALSGARRVIEFGPEHVLESAFDFRIRWGTPWLHSAARLIRAAGALMRQHTVDRSAQDEQCKRRADIGSAAAMLACFAVENALKAVIAERLERADPTTCGDGEQPKELDGHDLKKLSQAADLAPQDKDEEDVISFGQDITEWIGRYPSPKRARDEPAEHALDPKLTFDACLRLVLRAFDDVSKRAFERAARRKGDLVDIAKSRASFERFIAGISPVYPGEVLLVDRIDKLEP